MLDKTIDPSFTSIDTIGPRHALYRQNLIMPGPGNERLTPSFFVYEEEGIRKIDIKSDHAVFRIGAGAGNDIVLRDPSVSEYQVTVMRMGGECYFMDCGEKDVVQFNGVQKRQEIVPAESRMVMRIGKTWVIYIGIDFHKYDETDSVILKRSLIRDALAKSYGEFLLKYGDHEWHSSKAPILVGSHNACDYRIDDEKCSPFEFMVYFSPTGLYVEDIAHNGLTVNGNSAKVPMKINQDSKVMLGDRLIYLYLYGEVDTQCQHLFSNLDRQPGLMLSHMRNGCSLPLPKTSRRMSIGRSEEADIILEDTAASRIHAHIMIREKYLLIQDNSSSNKTFVNLAPITKAHLRPGDIVEMGDSCFLLHYQL